MTIRSIWVPTLLIVWGAFISAGGRAAASFVVLDEVNSSFVPDPNFFWNAAEVGWVYTPDFSYQLTGVATRFAGTDGRTVTLEVYAGIPVKGGTLLRSADYVPATQQFTQAAIAPLQLMAGTDYFIGYRNTAGLHVNVAIEMEAENLPVYFSFSNTGSYDLGPKGEVFTGQPILQFLGVPEPTSPLWLAGLGVVAVAGRRSWGNLTAPIPGVPCRSRDGSVSGEGRLPTRAAKSGCRAAPSARDASAGPATPPTSAPKASASDARY